MRAASARLVAQMERIVESNFFGDTANYITRAQTSVDTFGQPVYTETTTAITCSFTDKVSIESWKAFVNIQVVDAEIRFSSVVPSMGHVVTITGRFDNSAFVDKRYEIVGIKNRGAFGYVCALRAVGL